MLFCRRASYKLKTAPIPTVVLDCTLFENNVPRSKRALHCVLVHWFRVECHSALLAP
jgi:hypothetical protein